MGSYLTSLVGSSFVALTIAACSSSSSKGGETVGDQCSRVLTAFCSRGTACGAQVGNDCVASGVANCCGGQCTQAAVSADTDVDSCAQAMGTIDCTAFNSPTTVASAIPGVCQGVVKHQSFAPALVAMDHSSFGAQFSSVIAPDDGAP
jgi:hypothetical protein